MLQEEGECGKEDLAPAPTQPPAEEGLAPVPPPRCCFDFVPFSQPTGNVLLNREVCSVQGAPDSSFPLEFSAGEGQSTDRREFSLPRKAVNVAGGVLSPPRRSPPPFALQELF